MKLFQKCPIWILKCDLGGKLNYIFNNNLYRYIHWSILPTNFSNPCIHSDTILHIYHIESFKYNLEIFCIYSKYLIDIIFSFKLFKLVILYLFNFYLFFYNLFFYPFLYLFFIIIIYFCKLIPYYQTKIFNLHYCCFYYENDIVFWLFFKLMVLILLI
jgi:hypothetical protein